MRFHWLLLTMALGTGLISSAARAVDNTKYLTIRNTTPLTSIADTADLDNQFSDKVGQVIELQGTVNGVFTGDNRTGYLLQINQKQTLVLTSEQADRDIAVGHTLRVLARIPQQGAVLESIAVTSQGSELAQSDLANLRQNTGVMDTSDVGIDIVTDTQIPRVRYYHAPDLTPDATTQQPSPTAPPMADVNLPLAQQPQVVQTYTQRIIDINGDISTDTAQKIAVALLRESEEHDVDPRLIFALITQESRFNPRAVSPVGAQGLGQLMPGTAAGLGVHDAFDINDNMDGTVRYVASQLKSFGRLSLALAAYNAGPGNVQKYGGVPPFSETKTYVRKIWTHYAKLAGIDPKTGQQIASD